jgi:pimeloyl-ACP methyl ester carboxylesterase
VGIRRLFAILAVLAAVLTVSAVPGAAAPATGAQAGRAKLQWRNCEDGFQCARLRVPRDWDRPRKSGTIKLALIRLPATSKSVGSLLINYGGPGASGLTSLRQSGKLIRRATRGRLHVVSWDPRSVGESAPIKCPEGNDGFFQADPFTREGIEQMGAAVAERARACSARYGSYLSDIGTDQVVKDMNEIRKAVGDRKVNFLGLSYGTRVGAVYAQNYPTKVRTMVLDGSLPPVSTATEISQGLAVAFETALNEYFARCGQARSCVWGANPAARFDAVVADLRANPPEVPGTGGRRLTVGLFYQVVLAMIINFSGSTQAAEIVLGPYLSTGDPTNLYAFSQIIAGNRQPDGTFLSNSPETFQFIDCLDRQDRPTVAQVGVLAEQSKAIAPRLGPFGVTFALMNMTGCPERAKPVPPPTSRKIPPLLVVGNDNDPETPIHSSQLLSEALPNSRLLVWQGFGHTAFTTSPCIAPKAGRYLVTRRLPSVGSFCPDLPLAPVP